MSVIVKLLPKDAYTTLVNKLLESYRVYAPVRKNNQVRYDAIRSINDMDTDYVLPVLSAKSLVFPPVEPLFSFVRTKDSVDITPPNLEAIPECILLGVRPCDARGIDVLHRTFAQEPTDEIVEARLNKTILIGLSCAKADESCFCGNKAGDTTGSDILLTRLSDGDYLAEIVSEKGYRLFEQHAELFKDPAEPPVKELHVAKVRGVDALEELPERLQALFNTDAFEQQSLACIGCGTCTYVCPACGCFDIQDETRGSAGKRLRCWDSCGFSCFTQHTSGHNPRETQGQRWRQRMMHKFNYLPATQHVFGCVGCGRCIRSCPVNLDIAHLLIHITHEHPRQ